MRKNIFLAICLLMAFPNWAQEVQHRFLASGSGMKNIVIVNQKGNLEWEYPSGRECNDLSMLPDSTILFSCKTGAKLVNLKKEVLWEYKGEEGTEVQSASPLKNGRFLIMQNGTPAKLMEIDRKGRIRKELHIPTTVKRPHGQFRNIRKTLKGTYLIGYFSEQKVCEYNKKGKLLRTIPMKGNAFSAVRLPNGNILIPCGDGHHLMEVNSNNKVVWEVTENEIKGHPLRFVAGVQRLPNGNTVICNWGGHGHRNGQPQIFEITRDKKVVWEVCDWENLKTISTIQLLDISGDMRKGELLR